MLLPLYQVSCREAQTSSDSYLSHWGLTDSLLQCLRNTNFRNKPPFCTVETCDLAFKLLTLLIFLLTHLNPQQPARSDPTPVSLPLVSKSSFLTTAPKSLQHPAATRTSAPSLRLLLHPQYTTSPHFCSSYLK